MDQQSSHLDLPNIVERSQPAQAQPLDQRIAACAPGSMQQGRPAAFSRRRTSAFSRLRTWGKGHSGCMRKPCPCWGRLLQERRNANPQQGTRKDGTATKGGAGAPDVGVGEGLGGVGNLGQNLTCIAAAKHGQLVHRPVPASSIPALSGPCSECEDHPSSVQTHSSHEMSKQQSSVPS